MASFTDNAGRVWHLSITAHDVKRVRDRTGAHLGKLLDDNMKGLTELVGDSILFVDVLWVLCEEQAAKLGVTDEQFGRALGGDAAEEAGRAFEDAFLLFCPSRIGRMIRPVLEKVRAQQEAQADEVVRRIEAADPSIFTTSASSAPESSESTPAPTPAATS